MTLTYGDNTSFTGRVDGTGEGLAATTDEPRPAQFSGRRITADAECFGAGHAAAHLREIFYDDAGAVTEVIDLAPGSDCVALCIPIGQWHGVEVLESGTVILECKDGAYEPLGEEDIMG